MQYNKVLQGTEGVKSGTWGSTYVVVIRVILVVVVVVVIIVVVEGQ